MSKKLEGLSKKEKTKVKNEVAEYVLTEIENHTQAETSPVDGSTFKKLSKKYAEIKKKRVGNKDPDLHLTNRMLDSLMVKNKENGIEFKITDRKEKLKSFNHNKGDTLPKRQFLPDDSKGGKFGTFNQNIRKGIDSIVRKAKRANKSKD